MGPRLSRSTLMLASSLALTTARPGLACAQDGGAQLGSIEKQIQSLQAELRHMRAEMAARNRELRSARGSQAYVPPPPASQPAPITPQIPAGYALVPSVPGTAGGSLSLVKVEQPPAIPKGSFQLGGVNVQLGGFFEGASYYRSRNEVTDLTSNFNSAIPLRNSPLYHEAESGFSARQSRLTASMTANPDEVTKLQGYVAMDFLSAAPTANYNESSSFNPRLREAWITYNRSDWGFYALAGQSWTLVTMNTKGVDPTAINAPLQIDPQYVVGFDWARQAQFRVAKSFFHDQYWLALSIENPETIVSGTAPKIEGSTINQTNPGTGVDGNTTVSSVPAVAAGAAASAVAGSPAYSNNFAPDVVLKATADYDIGHLEAFGLGRVFNDRVSQLGTGQNNTQIGGGVGGGAFIHAIPKKLDVQLSGLVGEGVGRYGTSQLADSTYNYQGKPVPLPGYSVLAGVVGHPTPQLDLYSYVGVEHVSARYDLSTSGGKLATLAGYGSNQINNTSCETELSSTPVACAPASSGDGQITVGGWYKFIQGPYGKMQIGTQYSYTRRYLLQGIGKTPKTDENMVFFSFRWYPFT